VPPKGTPTPHRSLPLSRVPQSPQFRLAYDHPRSVTPVKATYPTRLDVCHALRASRKETLEVMMSVVTLPSWRHRLMALGCVLSVLLFSVAALAAGRIDWGSKTLKPNSSNNAWNIELKMFMGRPPDVPTVPMKFTFDQQVYFERSMVDGDKLLEREVPIVGKQPIVEGVDVGFLDPGSGKIESRTKFSFKIHRDHGFESGKYKVTVRDTRNGQIVGQPVMITLGGENEVIDRRSVVFTGEKKKKVEDKPADSSDSTDKPADSSADKPADSSASDDKTAKKAEAAPASEVPPADEPATDDQAGEIKKKPGGCGCRMSDSTSQRGSSLGLLVGLGLWAARRRRVSARRS
jgi:MYXO-CTERM domain-containing protein